MGRRLPGGGPFLSPTVSHKKNASVVDQASLLFLRCNLRDPQVGRIQG